MYKAIPLMQTLMVRHGKNIFLIRVKRQRNKMESDKPKTSKLKRVIGNRE